MAINGVSDELFSSLESLRPRIGLTEQEKDAMAYALVQVLACLCRGWRTAYTADSRTAAGTLGAHISRVLGISDADGLTLEHLLVRSQDEWETITLPTGM